MSGCGGGGGGGGGGAPCSESETCPDGSTCGPKEDCILRDSDAQQWGCKKSPECKEDEAVGVVCTGLASSSESPAVGDSLTLTCGSDGSSSVDHFEFRYKIGNGNFQRLDNGAASGSDKQFHGTAQLAVAQGGSYKVQCRVCKKAGGECTEWGKNK